MSDRSIQWVDLIPACVASALVGSLVMLWWVRIPYPYDLEWMEGGMLAHAWRLEQGLGIYVAPTPDFIPFVYPPGYASLVAVVAQVFGMSVPVARLVALTGCGASAGALVYGIWRQTGSLWMGVVSAAVFLGAYPESGAFYDLIRPDTLYTAFVAWAIVLGMERRRGAPVAAGLLLAAGFLIKQNAAAFGLPILIGLWYRDGWRNASTFALASAVPAGLMTVYLQWSTGGHFLTYLLDVPTSHPRIWSRVLPGMFRDIGTAMPVVLAVLGTWTVLVHSVRVRRLPEAVTVGVPVAVGVAFAWYGFTLGAPAAGTHHLPGSVAFWSVGAGVTSIALYGLLGDRPSWQWVYGLGVLGVGCVMASLMRAHNGGFLNVYMHLHWLLAFGFGVVLAQWRQASKIPVFGLTAGLVVAQLGWQLGRLDREQLAPTQADRDAGDAYVEALRGVDGEVLSPFASWLPVYAGKEPSLHLIALWDLNYKGGPYFPEVEDIKRAVRQHRWEVVLDSHKTFGYGVGRHYMAGRSPEVPDGALAPKTGWPAYPVRVLVPKADN